MGAGLILVSFVHEPWQLYLTLGALVGGGPVLKMEEQRRQLSPG
jgi:hypothetical protein